MKKYIGVFSPQLYALLRIIAGLMFAMHGSQKLFGWPGDSDPVELFSLMGLAGIVELFGGILIMIGLFASIAAFICSGQMAVAFFMVHAPQHWNPLINEGELAAVYCFLFLYIASKGAGIWSVDGERKKTVPAL
ncbi:DoxX family protein [Negadavirga shengliensis]|jgi:putative oxidoreductase|uniref:DoxX family protein n=1 Tax=Negadavirga shengliensis TaxID=1389218 RepID=A0ABV9T874_9BACT